VCVDVVVREWVDTVSPGVCPAVVVKSTFDGNRSITRDISKGAFVDQHWPGRMVWYRCVVSKQIGSYISHVEILKVLLIWI
jgi:hypothetical protein